MVEGWEELTAMEEEVEVLAVRDKWMAVEGRDFFGKSMAKPTREEEEEERATVKIT